MQFSCNTLSPRRNLIKVLKYTNIVGSIKLQDLLKKKKILTLSFLIT